MIKHVRASKSRHCHLPGPVKEARGDPTWETHARGYDFQERNPANQQHLDGVPGKIMLTSFSLFFPISLGNSLCKSEWKPEGP